MIGLIFLGFTLAGAAEAEINIIGSWVTGLSHPNEPGNNRALVFIAHAEHTSDFCVTSVTYGGQPMTKVIDANTGTPTAQAYVATYILDEAGIAAATGGTFVPTWNQTPLEYSYTSVFLSNVDQITPIGATGKNGTPDGTTNPILTDPLSTSDGDMVIAAATAGFSGDYTVNNDFTKAYENDMATSVGAAGYKSATGVPETPSVTHAGDYLNRQVISGFVVQNVNNANIVRIMPLGDSITRGYWGSANHNGYRKPLYDKLTDANHNFDLVGGLADGNFPDPNHEGHGGWCADGCPVEYGDVNDNVYNWLTANPADIILLHIGTNDITRNGEDANEVSAILDEIDRFSTDIKVVLALIIDRVPNDSRTTQYNIDVNNMAQSRIAAGDDIVVVDMNSVFNYIDDMYDNLHPNDVGYTKMADVWFDALDNIITAPLITSTPPTNTTILQLYHYDVNASGYPKPTYELTIYPAGMIIDQNTGLIEWFPTAAGDFNVTVVASNGQISDTNQSFVITVDHIIKFDAASSSSSSADGNVLSWQHIIGDSNNRILLVGITGDDNDANDLVINSVKYNDVNMALVEDSNVTVGSGNPVYYMKTELYHLLDTNLPPLSGNYTVSVTYNGSVRRICGGAISLAHVAQQAREAVAANSNVDQNSISTNITTQTDNAWVIDVVGCGNTGSFLITDSMVERFDVNSDTSSAAGSTKLIEFAQETTLSWTHSGANQLAHSAAAFAPSSYIIAGCINEPNDAPIENVSVSADANGGSDITDANGRYEVWVPYGWSGDVTPTKNGYLFAPSERTYSYVITDLLEQNYIDIVIYDLDTDGFIGWGDVKIIGENWLQSGADIPGDFHKDNIINFLDLAEFATVWWQE